MAKMYLVVWSKAPSSSAAAGLGSEGRREWLRPGWTDIERDQTAVSRLIGFFQPLKGLVLLTQLCLDEGKIKGFSTILRRDRCDDPG